MKLATQVFSATVASGILSAIATNCFKTEADKKIAAFTAQFLLRMNTLFDNLNSYSINTNNPDRHPILEYSDTLTSIMATHAWISQWESVGKIKKPYCFTGLLQTLQGMHDLWQVLKENQSYILLGHLNTDVAENVFSLVRSNRGSYEQNPSTYRFIRNLKQIIFKNLKSSDNAGYLDAKAESFIEEDELTCLKEIESFEEFSISAPIENDLVDINVQTENNIENSEDEEDQSAVGKNCFVSKESAEKLRKSALTFYVGFAAFKLHKKLNCSDCTHYMVEKDNQEREQTILIKLRAYKTVDLASEFGNLNVPTMAFEPAVKIILKQFNRVYHQIKFQKNLLAQLTESVAKIHLFAELKCKNMEHHSTISKFILIGLIKFSIKKTNKLLLKPRQQKSKKIL